VFVGEAYDREKNVKCWPIRVLEIHSKFATLSLVSSLFGARLGALHRWGNTGNQRLQNPSKSRIFYKKSRRDNSALETDLGECCDLFLGESF
jgi:hypothetical protein